MLHQFLLELAIKAVIQASLEGQATPHYKAIPHANATKWRHWGIFNTWEDKLRTCFNDVQDQLVDAGLFTGEIEPRT